MFGSSLTLFRVYGVDIKVDLSWAFIALLIAWSLASGYFPAAHEGLPRATYWAMGLVAVIGIFISIVVHELAHSAVARSFGIRMDRITLFMFGGAAEMGGEPPNAQAEFWMALAGPLASVAVAIILFLIVALIGSEANQPIGIILRYLAMLNLVLAAFNLLPAFPLDGGRILRSIIWGVRGNFAEATRIATTVGAGFGFILALFGLVQILSGRIGDGLWIMLIGFFIRTAALASRFDSDAKGVLSGDPVSKFMTTAPVVVAPDLAVSDFVETVVYRTRHDAYPVVGQDGTVHGMLAVGAIADLDRAHWADTPVRSLMTAVTPDMSIEPGADASDALDRMRRAQVSRLLVLENGRLIGLLTLKDLLETLTLVMQLGDGRRKQG